jgi:hypothetical protein
MTGFFMVQIPVCRRRGAWFVDQHDTLPYYFKIQDDGGFDCSYTTLGSMNGENVIIHCQTHAGTGNVMGYPHLLLVCEDHYNEDDQRCPCPLPNSSRCLNHRIDG